LVHVHNKCLTLSVQDQNWYKWYNRDDNFWRFPTNRTFDKSVLFFVFRSISSLLALNTHRLWNNWNHISIIHGVTLLLINCFFSMSECSFVYKSCPKLYRTPEWLTSELVQIVVMRSWSSFCTKYQTLKETHKKSNYEWNPAWHFSIPFLGTKIPEMRPNINKIN